MKKFSILLFLFFANATFCLKAIAQCECITTLRESMGKKNPEDVLSSFINTFGHYYSGSRSGPTIFDLETDEIIQMYHQIYKVPKEKFKEYQASYIEGIESLKSDDQSGTYDKEKAQLIFRLDADIPKRQDIFEYQGKMNTIGYSSGKPDAYIGEKTKISITNFQKEQGLTKNGRFDEETKSAIGAYLDKLNNYTSRLSDLNSGNSNNILVTLEYTKNPIMQYVVISKNGVLYRGNNVNALMLRVSKIINKSTITVYFDTRYFPENKIDAFVTTCKINLRNLKQLKIDIRNITGETADEPSTNFADIQDSFFSPGEVFVENSLTESSVETEGSFSGKFFSKFSFTNKAKTLTLKIYSKSKEIMETFKHYLSPFFESSSPSIQSIPDMINDDRRKLKIKFNKMSNDDLIIELQDELGNTNFVAIPVFTNANG